MAESKKKNVATKKKTSSSAKSNTKKPGTAKKAATSANRSGKKPSTSGKSTAKRSRTAKKKSEKRAILCVVLVALVILFAFLGNAYYKKMLYYQEHFFPGTVINGTDCSEMTAQEAKQTIQSDLNAYTFTFTDHEGRSSTISAEEIEVLYADDGEVEEILSGQDSLKWAFREKKEDVYSVTSGYTYNEEKLSDWIDALPCLQDGTAPTDAFEYMGEDGYWHIEAEKNGDLMEPSVVEDLIVGAVDRAQAQADLDGVDCFIYPSVTAEDEALNASVFEKNAAIKREERIDEITDVSLTFNSYIDKAYLDKELLKEMITDDENGDPIIDPSQVEDWVRSWAEERGLDEEENLFVTHGGRLMYVGYGVIGGWQLDVEATAQRAYQAIADKNSGILFPVTKTADGQLQSDDTYVEINILKQKMWYYQDGEEILETSVVTGDIIKGTDTPTNGIWTIYYKTTNYTMHGPRLEDGRYEYTTYVNYWMPFNDQIGIHDMTSRDVFGGEIYKGNGSHGCINTPLENVKVIYENASIGTKVIVHS